MLLGAKIKFYVLRLVVWLPTEVSDLFTSAYNNNVRFRNKFLIFESGISNDFAGLLLYLPLVRGDNNFLCCSSDAMANK
jgi:hypothetical protein